MGFKVIQCKEMSNQSICANHFQIDTKSTESSYIHVLIPVDGCSLDVPDLYQTTTRHQDNYICRMRTKHLDEERLSCRKITMTGFLSP